MRVICSGCKKLMGHKPGPGDRDTHSICRRCWARLYGEIPVDPEVEEHWKELEAQESEE